MKAASTLPGTRVEPIRTDSVESAGPDSWQWGGTKALTCQSCGAGMLSDETFCGQCGTVAPSYGTNSGPPADSAMIERPESESTAVPKPELVPEISPAGPAATPARALFDDDPEFEPTPTLPEKASGAKFVLQVSTGESVAATGSGLIGRNPVPEPGEHFDLLVRVNDPSRSVSKTHLEFGQLSGSFWVMDRYSGNGTVLREPEAAPVRCEPERRYLVTRGTRIEIGEQFIIVS